MIRMTVSALVSAVAFAAAAHAETKLLRYPDIHGETIAFTYGGDIWLASTSGGGALRLTSGPGLELFPKFSPDGQSIAFTAQYGGDEQVYVIPVAGGEARQLTFYPSQGPLPDRWGFDHQVYGWTPDGQSVIFRSVRDGYELTDGRLYTVPAEGGLPEPLPMKVSGAGILSPDGTQAVFSPLFRDFRTWKRYEGGWAQDLYLFNLDGSGSVNITDHPRTDRDPMWIGDTIYFASDRDDYLNIYSYDPATRQIDQVTDHVGADVRWPSEDPASGRIVYELAGSLRIFDVETGEDRAVTITVGDDASRTRPEMISVEGDLEDFHLSPDGARAVVSARGEVFTAPVEGGITRALTATPGAHERAVAWSPKGDLVAYISDETGEEQIWVRDQLGREAARQVTTDFAARLSGLLWSPDGKQLAVQDSEARIFAVDVATGNRRQVADDGGFYANDYAWSPDSRYLAYSTAEPTGMRSLHIWELSSGTARPVSDPLFSAYGPSFSPDGKHLYFVSDREFAPLIDGGEWNYARTRQAGVFALALSRDSGNPFLPKNVEVTAGDADDDKDESDAAVATKIDWDGLSDRVIRAPIEPDNIFAVAAGKDHVFYITGGAFFYGRSSGVDTTLHAYSLEDRETETLIADIDGAAFSADGKFALIAQSGGLARIALNPSNIDQTAVSLGGLETRRVLRDEYYAIFDAVWRRFRDFFYVENMHGYDWEALRDQYRPLVEHVADRSDLNYILGEMVAELNAGHAYVSGGDLDRPQRPATALLGARLTLDGASGRYRVSEVLDGHNAEPKYRSPLTEVGVEVSVGEYLLAINGQDLRRGQNPYQLLQGLGDGLVELTVAKTASGGDTRRVIVDPLTSEDNLLYLRWTEANRQKVLEATDGRVGYFHIPDMGADGIYEFIKWYYGQIRKDGLIIDVRGNGGGNVSQMLINRLDRDLIFMGYARGIDHADTYPQTVFTGPMAAILDEDSASDGDIFPAAFQARGLGPLIGKRSWGGVVGITNHGPLLDGGAVNVPQFGHLDANGQHTIEGVGVTPDIEVDNTPDDLLAGRDPQLDRAIAEVEAAMQTQRAALPPRPADPVKTPRAR